MIATCGPIGVMWLLDGLGIERSNTRRQAGVLGLSPTSNEAPGQREGPFVQEAGQVFRPNLVLWNYDQRVVIKFSAALPTETTDQGASATAALGKDPRCHLSDCQ
jgi:hypothetical protein